jgi:hypothetical protein
MSGDTAMPNPTSSRVTLRQGIALPIAIAAIIAVGALIAGVFFASTQEYRVGRNTLATQRALHGAEVGLNSVVASWTPARTMKLKIGFRDTLQDTIIDESYVKREWVRVSPTMFWVTSTAVAGSLSLQQRSLKRLNTLVRVDIPDMKIQGAITGRGNVLVSGSATVIGRDTTPPGWPDCLEAGTPGAGLVVGDSAANATSGGHCGTGNTFTCITGSPKVADSAIYADSMTYKNFGGFNYDSLTKLATADKIYTGGGPIDSRQPMFFADGSCDRTHLWNWGDTSHVKGPPGCREYYPVVWLKGTGAAWQISNRGGQGILLVDGDVTFNGKFVWTGLVLVQGKLSAEGMQAPRVTGGIMAMNRNNTTHQIAGNITLQFSRCALQAVTARLATARQTQYRAWADMSF